MTLLMQFISHMREMVASLGWLRLQLLWAQYVNVVEQPQENTHHQLG